MMKLIKFLAIALAVTVTTPALSTEEVNTKRVSTDGIEVEVGRTFINAIRCPVAVVTVTNRSEFDLHEI